MKKKFLLIPFLLLVMVFTIVSCGPTEDKKENETTECTHTNTEWRVEKEATCDAEGSQNSVCLSCYKTIATEAIPAKGHTYVDNKCACGSIQIADVAGLQAFGQSLTHDFDYSRKTVTLLADLDMTGVEWKIPMGAFAGTFEGNGHTISNLVIKPAAEYITQYVGFFSKNSGKILDLTLKNVSVKYAKEEAPHAIGCLAGSNIGTIQNCHVEGTLSVSAFGYSASSDIGGLLGSSTGTVDRCSAQVNITGSAYKNKGNSTFGLSAGGLIGDAEGTVSNCFATGNVTVGAEHFAKAAGLIATAAGTIENCYATGNSSASIKTSGSSKYPCASGALFAEYGNYNTSKKGTVSNCFATGNASATYAAGLVPMITEEVTNCYYAEGATVSGSSIATATKAGTAIALDTIKTAAFGQTLTWSTDVWTFTDGAYPTLK